MTTSEPPVLQGCIATGAKSSTVSTNQTQNSTHKQALNAYSLPSIGQTIKYLHAAAGYPPEETWTKAIRAGNYNTWPSLTITNVHKHHPESDVTQKGHMKCQRQGIQSTKTLATINEDKEDQIKPKNEPNPNPQTEPKAKKMKDIHIKIYNASNTMRTDQMGCFPATSCARIKYIMTLVEVDGNYIDA
jgi:hypothetical protein